MRVSLLTNCITPYRTPLWRELDRLCDLKVILLNTNHPRREWSEDIDALKLSCVSVESRHLGGRTPQSSMPIAWMPVIRAIANSKPEVLIITGWSTPGYWAALFWARRRRVPTVLWAESSGLSSRTESFSTARKIKSAFVRRCDSFIVPGRIGAQYLAGLGAAPERIVVARNTPDTGIFHGCESSARHQVASLLFVGRLVREKGVPEMLAALELLKDRPWTLNIVGGGPLEGEIRGWARRNGLADRVNLAGFVEPARMAAVYRSADILLLPTLNDCHPLVLPEALLSGVFVLGSDLTAGSHDLIESGVNGKLVSPGDTTGFARTIDETLASCPFDRGLIRRTFEATTPSSVAGEIVRAALVAFSAGGLSDRASTQGSFKWKEGG